MSKSNGLDNVLILLLASKCAHCACLEVVLFIISKGQNFSCMLIRGIWIFQSPKFLGEW